MCDSTNSFGDGAREGRGEWGNRDARDGSRVGVIDTDGLEGG